MSHSHFQERAKVNFAIFGRIRPKFLSVVVFDMLSSNLAVTSTKHLLLLLLLLLTVPQIKSVPQKVSHNSNFAILPDSTQIFVSGSVWHAEFKFTGHVSETFVIVVVIM